MIRIVIADDHPVIREGLKQLFALAENIDVVDEAENSAELFECLREGEVDVLLLDLSMPGLSGEDLIARLRTRHPLLPILVLSMHNETQVAQRALRAGASGYLTKDRDAETLLTAIRDVATGKRFFDPSVAGPEAGEAYGSGCRPQRAELTSREFRIMRLLAAGMTTDQIAELLDIGNESVNELKAHMMRKMGFATDTDIVRHALRFAVSR